MSYNFAADVFCISGVSPWNIGQVRSEGHLVKVKVTGSEKLENAYFCTVKLRSAITPFLQKT